MNVVVLGNGFVSSHLPYPKILDRIENSKQISKLLDKHKPDVIINCIGFTGRPNIDQCEILKSKTYFANVTIPCMLATECEKLGIRLVQLSSGCVYFGKSPNNEFAYVDDGNVCLGGFNIDLGWKESDSANPISYYSKTKYSTDLLLGELPFVTSLRLRMPISSKNDSRNFINKIKNYKQIINIPNSMTIMSDLVRCIDWVINNNKTGIYHVTNPEPITAVQVMNEYKKYNPKHTFDIITEQQLDLITKAKRSNCILNTNKLSNEGFVVTPSVKALSACMADYFRVT